MTMTSIFSSLMDSITNEAFAWWFSRATLVAVLACAYLALARRGRPATRHAIAVASLVAIVMLPAASAILPTLSLPVLPATPIAPAPAPRAVRALPFAIDTPAPAAGPSVAPVPAVSPVPVVQPVPAVDPKPARRGPIGVIGRVVLSNVRDTVASLQWNTVAVMTWLTVATCLLVWSGIGAIGARRLSRRSPAVSDEAFLDECERTCRVLGIRRTVDVGVSRDVAIPMVVGMLHPRVVIPTSAAAWSRERLRVVLLHELAHVQRRDGVWMLFARVIASVFWFHPLVWVLSRHVRREAERACDEIVLASGIRGSDYAEHLVAIARSALVRDPFAGSALALATRSSLEQRVVSILSTRVARATPSRRTLASAAAASLALFVTIAAARPTKVVSAQMTPTEYATIVEAHPLPLEDATSFVAPTTTEPGYEIDVANHFDYKFENKYQEDTEYYLADNNDDDDRSGREWYSRASDLYNRERFNRAGEAYENAAKLGYKTGTAYYNAGCSYALADQSGRAMDMLRASLDEGFDRPDLFASDSDLNSLRGDPRFQDLLAEVMKSDSAELSRRSATKDFNRLAKEKEVDDGDWNSVGIELLRSGDYEAAANAFDNEFKVSKDEDALYNKACARSLAGKKEDALELLEQSITTGSVDAEHMQEDPDLIALHDNARFDQLVSLAQDLDFGDGWWWQGGGHGKWSWNNDRKNWRKSVPHFEDMAKKHPQVGRAWFNLGYVQLASEDAKSSTASFQKALDLGYKPPTTMYNLACSSAQSGNVDGAIAWLEKAEKAGFEMWDYARWDDDLEPLHDDARFKAMAKRWKAEAKEKHKHDKDWDEHDFQWDDDDEDDDT